VPSATDALAQLCETYWPPIYSFIRRRGYPPPDAQDLTQSFFAFFLRTKAYARTDRLHGKFRSFLLASVKNFLVDDWDRNQAIRRGGTYQFVVFDPETAEAFYDAPSAIAVYRTGTGGNQQIDESVYNGLADTGSNFRIDSCQYVYNLNASALGVGTYRVDIIINGQVVGSATFQLR